MATLYPPPSKRQKLVQADKAREQQEIESIPSDLGSVRVQFFDQATGQPTGPAVSVPVADANVKNLETLLNTLQGNVRFEPRDYLAIECCIDGDFFPGR
jgi:ribosome assembly protein 4